MIPLNLFDVLTTMPHGDSPSEANLRVRSVAGQLLDASLQEWRELGDINDHVAPTPWDDRANASRIAREIYLLYDEWARSAEQVLSRIRHLPPLEADPKKVQELEDTLGLARARLKHTPEMQDRAFDQVRMNQLIPAKELRDDLNARLRAGREVPVART